MGIFGNVREVNIMPIIYLDLLLMLPLIVLIGVFFENRGDGLFNWKVRQTMGRLKEDYPYLNTLEFRIVFVTYLPILLLGTFVLQHYLREYLSLLLDFLQIYLTVV